MIEAERIATAIEDVWLQPLRIIPAAGGPVLHCLRRDYALMPSDGIGEVYFSEVEPGNVKAWKRHRRQSQLFAVPVGQIFIALYDGREGSRTFGALITATLGRPDNYRLLCIPPGVFYGFRAIGKGAALVCNCADMPHDAAEGERLPPDSPLIPFSWEEIAKDTAFPAD